MTRTSSPLLPDWMLNPPPPRLTLMQRATAPLTRRPAWQAAQLRWWRWRDRPGLHERYPTTFKITAFFASWVLSLTLLGIAYALYGGVSY